MYVINNVSYKHVDVINNVSYKHVDLGILNNAIFKTPRFIRFCYFCGQ
jgi:hypothetical protein